MSAVGEKRKKTDSPSRTWWGAEKCERCTNKAYYAVGDKLMCGVHSRNVKRTELPKNPNAVYEAIDRRVAREKRVEEVALENQRAGREGTLTVAKLLMMREPPHVDDVRNVFPNNKHQNRQDGFGCASLSPMQLGPVKHNQPGVPEALSIENYHQFNKVFARELDGSVQDIRLANVKPAFFTARDAAYRDPVPHRRKFDDEKGIGGNRNIPVFSIHIAPNGDQRRYTYQQSRYFYCHQYELLAKETHDFKKLCYWLANGYDLQIVGYDGYPITKTLMEHYMDPEKPFGHELVLYSLLSIRNPVDYPWNVFYRQNRELYD